MKRSGPRAKGKETKKRTKERATKTGSGKKASFRASHKPEIRDRKFLNISEGWLRLSDVRAGDSAKSWATLPAARSRTVQSTGDASIVCVLRFECGTAPCLQRGSACDGRTAGWAWPYAGVRRREGRVNGRDR